MNLALFGNIERPIIGKVSLKKVYIHNKLRLKFIKFVLLIEFVVEVLSGSTIS